MNTKLREKRESQNKTQMEMAQCSRISLKSYQRIEKGAQEPKVTTAKLIAKALKTTVEKLF